MRFQTGIISPFLEKSKIEFEDFCIHALLLNCCKCPMLEIQAKLHCALTRSVSKNTHLKQTLPLRAVQKVHLLRSLFLQGMRLAARAQKAGKNIRTTNFLHLLIHLAGQNTLSDESGLGKKIPLTTTLQSTRWLINLSKGQCCWKFSFLIWILNRSG